MKILHINDTYAMTGGIARYLFHIMELLEGRGHENVVAYQYDDKRTITDSRRTYGPLHSMASTSSESVLRRIVEGEKPDIIYLHAIYDPTLIQASTQMAPTVAYVHNFHSVCPGLGKFFRRGDAVCERAFGPGCVPNIYLRRCCDAKHPRSVMRIMRETSRQQEAFRSVPKILVASKYMRSLLEQNGVESRQIGVLPYPHALKSFDNLDPSSPPRVFFAGRLEIEKGVPYLLQAFAKADTRSELRIAGDGTLRSTYESMAHQLGISSRVKFLGWLNDQELDREYGRSRVVVMTSIFPEPFGLVGIEALMRKRPVIAFDVGGISDWLKHEEHGYLVAARDSDDMAAKIDRLLGNQSGAETMGLTGHSFVAANYSPDTHLEQLLDIFEAARNS